jgi:hypothetical protein
VNDGVIIFSEPLIFNAENIDNYHFKDYLQAWVFRRVRNTRCHSN